MTTPTSDFSQKLMQGASHAFDQGIQDGYRLVWKALVADIHQYWILISIFLTIVLAVAIMQARHGRYGRLSSVLYHYFYFGILLSIGFTFGPAIFASPYMDIGLIILYVVCYRLVGMILRHYFTSGQKPKEGPLSSQPR